MYPPGPAEGVLPSVGDTVVAKSYEGKPGPHFVGPLERLRGGGAPGPGLCRVSRSLVNGEGEEGPVRRAGGMREELGQRCIDAGRTGPGLGTGLLPPWLSSLCFPQRASRRSCLPATGRPFSVTSRAEGLSDRQLVALPRGSSGPILAGTGGQSRKPGRPGGVLEPRGGGERLLSLMQLCIDPLPRCPPQLDHV